MNLVCLRVRIRVVSSDFVVFENNEPLDDNSEHEYDSKNYGDEIYGVDSGDERPYLDKAYVGKKYEKSSKGQITLERGMLFVNVDAFREALKDYVIQEGFEIVRIRNERSRITAMCADRGCEWYLHASTNPDKVTFEIKVYDGKHTCVKPQLTLL